MYQILLCCLYCILSVSFSLNMSSMKTKIFIWLAPYNSTYFVCAQLCPTLCDPVNCSLPGSFVHGIFQARILESVAISYSRRSSRPRDQTRVSCISCIGRQVLLAPLGQADSLPTKPQGKPKNTGVGSLSLLQWIFPTQELNQDLLHCRWILYQLSSQGNPNNSI